MFQWQIHYTLQIIDITLQLIFCISNLIFRPYLLFPVLSRITFGKRIKKNSIFYFIWCFLYYNGLFFGESRSILSFTFIKIRFYPILRSTCMIEIHFTWYVENVKLFFSQKSQIDLVEKIKNKDKNRTCASLFQSSEDGKQKNCFMSP